MKTDMWAVGEDPDDIDIMVEELQPGLTPAEEALEALKKSEELRLPLFGPKQVSSGGKPSSFSKASQQPLNPRLLQSHHLLWPPPP